MKKITVADILELEILKGARVAAGQTGLTKEVRYVNVYDNPFSESEQSVALFPGDIYLSFLYYGQNDPVYLEHTVQLLLDHEASALIVFDEYFKEFPPELSALCDEKGLPVIFLDYKTPYSLVISSIMESRIQADQRKNIADKLAAIVSSRTSEKEKSQLITELNPNFQNNIIVLFAMETGAGSSASSADMRSLCSAIGRDSRFFVAEYRDGLLCILSSSESRLAEAEKTTDYVAEIIHQYLPEASIGVSDICHLTDLGTAISQSYAALSAGRAKPSEIFRYHQLGVGRILLDLAGTPALETFYQDMIGPICKCDAETGSQLFDTMICFAGCNMDYKRTATQLFLHENTIRYRIHKIKELIPFGISEIDFYETISIVAKIYWMKQF